MAAILRVVDPPLAKHLAAIESDAVAPDAASAQPLPFLFQPILLRFKREMRDYEQTRRLWEVRRVEYSRGTHTSYTRCPSMLTGHS